MLIYIYIVIRGRALVESVVVSFSPIHLAVFDMHHDEGTRIMRATCARIKDEDMDVWRIGNDGDANGELLRKKRDEKKAVPDLVTTPLEE